MLTASTIPMDDRASRQEPIATRCLDLVLALLLCVFALPISLLAALAIWLEGGGPVLYRQTRVGLGGTPFQLLKFRSMRLDAESDGIPRWAAEDDPRVTCVGRILRQTRIDELPQLWNVLKGEMRVIGPRPERPCFVRTLAHQLPRYARRHALKPGITGWAQVRDRYAASIEDCARKLEFDLFYVEHRSAALDLLILLETVWIVLAMREAR